MCYGNSKALAHNSIHPVSDHSSSGNASKGPSTGGDSEYSDWISKLACLMNGTWYSTQKKGECLPDGSNKHSCWWKVTSPSVNGKVLDSTPLLLLLLFS